MTDHADFVSFSAAFRTACGCGVSRGQGLRVSASREGERHGSTARLPAEGPALPLLPAQQRAQGEPEQGGILRWKWGMRELPAGKRKASPTPTHLHPRGTHLHPCAWVSTTSAPCWVPVCAAHLQYKPEVLFSLFKQLS